MDGKLCPGIMSPPFNPELPTNYTNEVLKYILKKVRTALVLVFLGKNNLFLEIV